MLHELTDRENEILMLIAYGLTNKEIAQDLSISLSTVENHIHSIYEKLGITNRAMAVVRAYQAGLVPVNDILEK